MTRAGRPSNVIILAHGGAGARKMTAAQGNCLGDALVAGHAVLKRGGAAVDAVETTIRILEGSGLFNAGAGARLQLDGARRMDASIMEGSVLRAGAVAGIEQVRHPITAARLVMDNTAHVLLMGDHATRFARHFKLDRQPPLTKAQRKALRGIPLTESQRQTLILYKYLALSPGGRGEGEGGTVGAVALDRSGTVAAGASTGGIPFMLPGRVGDSPLIGCGVYADNESGAASMTGLGESIIRLTMAKEIVDRMAVGAGPATAARQALTKLAKRIEGAAGALVLAPDGRFAIRHTTPHMSAGWWNGKGTPVVRDRFT
jgi:beta-aspartyl-peptidase (threonine type)